MANTPLLGIQEVAAGQNQKEVTINDGFVAIENATQAAIGVSLTSNAGTLSAAAYTSAAVFEVSGQTAAATLTVPATERVFYVDNSAGGYAVTVNNGGTVGLAVPAGSVYNIINDGTHLMTTTGGGGAGGVSYVAAGSGLAGGTITGSGTLSLAAISAGNLLGNAGTVSAVPGAIAIGKGLTLSSAGTLSANTSLETLPIPFSFSGKPGAGQMIHVPLADSVGLTLGTNFSGLKDYVGTPPAANASFVLSSINGGTITAIGTVTLAGTSGAMSAISSGYTSAAGDVLRFAAPSTQDTTLSDVAFTFVATRTS